MSYLPPNQVAYSYSGFDSLCKFLQKHLSESFFHRGSVSLNFSFLYRTFGADFNKETTPQLNERFPAFHFTFNNSILYWERRNLFAEVRGIIVRQLQNGICQKIVIDDYHFSESLGQHQSQDAGIYQKIFEQLSQNYSFLELKYTSDKNNCYKLIIDWSIKPIYLNSGHDLILAYFKLFIDEFVEYPTNKINCIKILTYDLNIYLCDPENRSEIIEHFKQDNPDFLFKFTQQTISAKADLRWNFYVAPIEWEKIDCIKATSLSLNKHAYLDSFGNGIGHFVEYIDTQIYLAFKQKKAFGTIILPNLLFRIADTDSYQLSRLAQTRYSAYGMQVVNTHTLKWGLLSVTEWRAQTSVANMHPEECPAKTHAQCFHSLEECYVMATLRPFAQLTNPIEPGESVFFEFEPEVTQALSAHPRLFDKVRLQFEQKYPHRYFLWKQKHYLIGTANYHSFNWQFYSTPILDQVPILPAGHLEQWVSCYAGLRTSLSTLGSYLIDQANPHESAQTLFPSNKPNTESNVLLLQLFIFIYAYMKFNPTKVDKIVFSRSASFLLKRKLLEQVGSQNRYTHLITMIRRYAFLIDKLLGSINIKDEGKNTAIERDMRTTLSWTCH